MSLPKLVSVDGLRSYLEKWFAPPSRERILELVESGLFPHYRIDGGEPLFHEKTSRDWIEENLVKISCGEPIPVQLGTVGNGKIYGIPEEIRGLAHRLVELPLGPYAPCVYFLLRGEKVIYVGQSVALSTRLVGHMDKKFDRVFYIVLPRSSLDRVEGALIRSLRPELNGNLGPRSPVEEVLSDISGDCSEEVQ